MPLSLPATLEQKEAIDSSRPLRSPDKLTAEKKLAPIYPSQCPLTTRREAEIALHQMAIVSVGVTRQSSPVYTKAGQPSHILEGGSHMTPREEKGTGARVPTTPQLLN